MAVMSTGVCRPVDGLGRIVVPKELRVQLGWKCGTPIELYVEDESDILLKKYGCVFCDSSVGLIHYKGEMVCRECWDKLCSLASG